VCPSNVPDTQQGRLAQFPGRGTGQSRFCHHRAAMTDVHWDGGLHPPMPWFEDATAPLWQCTRSSDEALDRGARCQSGTADVNDLPHRKRTPGRNRPFPFGYLGTMPVSTESQQSVSCLSSASSSAVANSHLQQLAADYQTKEMEVRWSCVHQGRVRASQSMTAHLPCKQTNSERPRFLAVSTSACITSPKSQRCRVGSSGLLMQLASTRVPGTARGVTVHICIR
jgi:hypothetical protein